MTSTATTTTVVNTGDHRLVGWGDYASLRGSIQHRLFGYLVQAAAPVVKEYHGDLFIDAETMTRWLDEHFAAEAGDTAAFLYCVRHSGTQFATSARLMFESVAYDAVLYNFEVRVDARGEWHLRIDLLDTRPTRPSAALPATHRTVLDKCEAEAWRNIECGDANTEADVAADIVQHLAVEYDLP